jgi:hypothetical protein
MENYIVRIYGRDPGDSDKVTGMLESVEQETRRPFHSLNALRSMLNAPATGHVQPADAVPTPCTQNKLSLVPLNAPRRFDN